jgi:ribosomal protein L44E
MQVKFNSNEMRFKDNMQVNWKPLSRALKETNKSGLTFQCHNCIKVIQSATHSMHKIILL